eukprot:6126427-Prymnesium_polylepis.1
MQPIAVKLGGRAFRWHHRQQTGSSSYEGEEKLYYNISGSPFSCEDNNIITAHTARDTTGTFRLHARNSRTSDHAGIVAKNLAEILLGC